MPKVDEIYQQLNREVRNFAPEKPCKKRFIVLPVTLISVVARSKTVKQD